MIKKSLNKDTFIYFEKGVEPNAQYMMIERKNHEGVKLMKIPYKPSKKSLRIFMMPIKNMYYK